MLALLEGQAEQAAQDAAERGPLTYLGLTHALYMAFDEPHESPGRDCDLPHQAQQLAHEDARVFIRRVQCLVLTVYPQANRLARDRMTYDQVLSGLHARYAGGVPGIAEAVDLAQLRAALVRAEESGRLPPRAPSPRPPLPVPRAGPHGEPQSAVYFATGPGSPYGWGSGGLEPGDGPGDAGDSNGALPPIDGKGQCP